MDAPFDLEVGRFTNLMAKEFLVQQRMSGHADELEVLDAVVGLAAVAVMHMLVGAERAAEMVLHHLTMLIHVSITVTGAAWVQHDDVAVLVDEPAPIEVRIVVARPSTHRIANSAGMATNEVRDSTGVVITQNADGLAASTLTEVLLLLGFDPCVEIDACHYRPHGEPRAGA